MRFLLVEDNADDAELLIRELRRGGIEVEARRVETAAQMAAALDEGGWDAVISDYDLPSFSGRGALELVRQSGLDLPFILVSGAIGEEDAVEAMKAGAHDYVRKENLRRLVPVVMRELREAEMRRGRRSDEKARAFLAQAGAILGASLDDQRLAEMVAKLVTPALADTCALASTRDHHAWMVVAHADGAGAHDDGPPAPPTAAEVIALAGNDAQLLAPPLPLPAAIVSLGGRSGLAVPLRARGRKLGAMLLVAERADRFGRAERDLVEELARRVALAIDNAALYAEAQEAIRVREEFLSVASHELKTPLTSLRLLGESLLRHAQKLAPGEVATELGKLMRQVDRLGRLVEDLLNVSRLRAGQLRLEPAEIDLAAQVRGAVEQMQVQAHRERCTLTLRAPDSLTVVCDPLRIEQVVINLLSNAIKYGAGKPVEVTLAREGALAVLRIRDQGVGLSPADHERVFKRFERASSPRHYGGLGLGLYIAAQIVSAHGGDIGIDSDVGKGATVTVKLPIAGPRS